MTFYVNPEDGDQPCEGVTSITVNLVQSSGNLTGQFTPAATALLCFTACCAADSYSARSTLPPDST